MAKKTADEALVKTPATAMTEAPSFIPQGDRTMEAKGWRVVRVQLFPNGWSTGASTDERGTVVDQVRHTVVAALVKRPA